MEDFLTIFLPIIAIAIVAGLYAFLLFWRRNRSPKTVVDKMKNDTALKSAPLTTYMEPMLLGFYQALKRALPDKYIINVNVPVEKLFEASYRARLKMQGQYADIVVFTPDLMPVLVIDLFDMSIINLERVNKLKTASKEIIRASGVPVLDYRCRDSYDINELRRTIADLLNPLRSN